MRLTRTFSRHSPGLISYSPAAPGAVCIFPKTTWILKAPGFGTDCFFPCWPILRPLALCPPWRNRGVPTGQAGALYLSRGNQAHFSLSSLNARKTYSLFDIIITTTTIVTPSSRSLYYTLLQFFFFLNISILLMICWFLLLVCLFLERRALKNFSVSSVGTPVAWLTISVQYMFAELKLNSEKVASNLNNLPWKLTQLKLLIFLLINSQEDFSSSLIKLRRWECF